MVGISIFLLIPFPPQFEFISSIFFFFLNFSHPDSIFFSKALNPGTSICHFRRSWYIFLGRKCKSQPSGASTREAEWESMYSYTFERLVCWIRFCWTVFDADADGISIVHFALASFWTWIPSFSPCFYFLISHSIFDFKTSICSLNQVDCTSLSCPPHSQSDRFIPGAIRQFKNAWSRLLN